MVAPRVGAAILGGAVVATLCGGCLEPFATPTCTPGATDTASVSGDTVTLSSGLRFIHGEAGSGAALMWCTNVAVHYTAYLLDGTQFDTSRELDRPLFFAPGLGSLIDGFEQGVIGMRTTGTRRLIIPPELAYGSEPLRDNAGTVIVPANSTVVFDVEILGIGS